jgi:hypothetical protein
VNLQTTNNTKGIPEENIKTTEWNHAYASGSHCSKLTAEQMRIMEKIGICFIKVDPRCKMTNQKRCENAGKAVAMTNMNTVIQNCQSKLTEILERLYNN